MGPVCTFDGNDPGPIAFLSSLNSQTQKRDRKKTIIVIITSFIVLLQVHVKRKYKTTKWSIEFCFVTKAIIQCNYRLSK